MFIAAIAMALPVSAEMVTVETDVVNFEFELNELEKTATLTGTKRYSVYALGNLTIPGTFIHDNTEYRVTCIGRKALSGYGELEAVSIPQNVERIESYAFQRCRNLKLVSIPESVTEIADDAFFSCDGLLCVINFSNSLQVVGDSTFLPKSVVDIYVPEKAKEAYGDDERVKVIDVEAEERIYLGRWDDMANRWCYASYPEDHDLNCELYKLCKLDAHGNLNILSNFARLIALRVELDSPVNCPSVANGVYPITEAEPCAIKWYEFLRDEFMPGISMVKDFTAAMLWITVMMTIHVRISILVEETMVLRTTKTTPFQTTPFQTTAFQTTAFQMWTRIRM